MSTNPPAFPTQSENSRTGMTLLDYFAAQAMIGWLISQPSAGMNTVAADSYNQAAAMLAERQRREAKE